jgi:hypothetical protein
MKAGAHCTTDDFGVPEVNGSWQRDDRRGPQGGRRPQDRSHVPGVLNGIQKDEPGFSGECEAVERPVGYLGDRQDALRRFRLGGARELERAHFRDVDAAVAKLAKERGPAGGVGELRSHEGTMQREGRADQFLHRTDPFGGEQPLPLTRFPTPEVAS